jgi:hypothetical protein
MTATGRRDKEEGMKRLKLTDHDYVITAYAERSSGHGWDNSPVWIIVRDGKGKMREECLQPEEQTAEMLTLYPICSVAHGAMRSAVLRAIKGRKG